MVSQQVPGQEKQVSFWSRVSRRAKSRARLLVIITKRSNLLTSISGLIRVICKPLPTVS